LQAAIESYYYLCFMANLPERSCIDIGRTQIFISKAVSDFKHNYTYCLDYSGWDITRQQVLGIISFEIIRKFLRLTGYHN
jgi:hypothetical protein